MFSTEFAPACERSVPGLFPTPCNRGRLVPVQRLPASSAMTFQDKGWAMAIGDAVCTVGNKTKPVTLSGIHGGCKDLKRVGNDDDNIDDN